MAKHPVAAYIAGVLDGSIPAGRLIRLAVERHVRDLDEGPKRGLRFDRAAAQHAIDFFGFLKHSKGEWAGQPFVLEGWQQFLVWVLFGWKRADGLRRFRTAYIEVPRKNGKTTLVAGLGLYLMVADGEPGAEVYSAAPLGVDTPIPTPDGWTTMGVIKEGDTVFDETGAPCRVTYASPVMTGRPCYEIVFSDGSRVVSDGEHRWQTEVYSSGRSLRGRKRADTDHMRRNGRTTAIYTTQEIRGSLIYECRGRSATNHRIPLAGALRLPDANLPIGPYTLGVWLGDGRNNRGSIVIHPDDAMIARQIEAEGYELSRQSGDQLFRFTVLGLRTALGNLGLLDNKHIPTIYLRSSIRQRLALLRGLMDTDGACTRQGECRFTNRNERLASDVAELVTSLGILPHLRKVMVAGQPHYIVSYKAYADKPVFGLLRKAIRQRQVPDARAGHRYIVAINPVESRSVRCISVDSPSHLYLVTRGMIPTHNTKRDQAKLSWGEAVRMVKASPALARMVKHWKASDNLSVEATASKFMPLGADADTMDGLNIHAALIDELHAHRTRAIVDVMETATGARRQPLQLEITTAGFDQNSVCYEHHEYSRKVLEGTVHDDTWFAYVAMLDEGDDWTDPRTWAKANPNLGVSVKIDDLQRKCEKAKHLPAAQNAFRRLHLNQWTQQSDRWIDLSLWDENAGTVDVEALAGRRCFGGLDLSAVSDLTAWLMGFPRDDDPDEIDILCRFWCPEARLTDPHNRYADQYQAWARDGYLTVTPGNAIDYQFVKAQILEDAQKYDLVDLNVDRLFQGYQLSQELADEGLTVFGMGQGFLSMAAPMKEFERRLLGKKLHHGGHPVLRFMAESVAVKQDPAGNLKPDKAASQGKIDGIVALVMLLDRAMRHADVGSVYDERGVRTL
jgi:phage terminase large subunit-like protein